MTEKEWLKCKEPLDMIDWICANRPSPFRGGTRSDPLQMTIPTSRKLRLFGVACCRAIWGLLRDARTKTVVEVAERFSDNNASINELRQAMKAADTATQEIRTTIWENEQGFAGEEGIATAASAAVELADGNFDRTTAKIVADNASEATGFVWKTKEASKHYQSRLQSDLLRCMFGNPFHSVTFHPTWLTPTAKALAEQIYSERAFDRMPILGDALEEAGCTLPDVLEHCRNGGEHVRGCWVVDLVLGKQ